jgi:hypothetical protein
MVTAHLVASTLASLTWLFRHAPASREAQVATLDLLASLVGTEHDLTVAAGLESLSINGTMVPIDAPGVHLLNEHLLMQGIRRVVFAAPVEADRVVGLCTVLAAYPGTFESFAELEIAAGVGPGLSLAEAPTELIFERETPGVVLLPDGAAQIGHAVTTVAVVVGVAGLSVVSEALVSVRAGIAAAAAAAARAAAAVDPGVMTARAAIATVSL